MSEGAEQQRQQRESPNGLESEIQIGQHIRSIVDGERCDIGALLRCLKRDEPIPYSVAMNILHSPRATEWKNAEQLGNALLEEIEQRKKDIPLDQYLRFRTMVHSKEKSRVDVRSVGDLPYWGELAHFCTGINDVRNINVVLVDDTDNDGQALWQTVFGSDPSKSSPERKTIFLKKSIFDIGTRPSEMHLSWLVHEIGHTLLYASLGPDAEAYRERTMGNGKYIDNFNESVAFQFQLAFLKSRGVSKEECRSDRFLGEYLSEEMPKEWREALERYVQEVYEA